MDDWSGSRTPPWAPIAAVVASIAAVVAGGALFLQQREGAELRADVAALERKVDAIAGRSNDLAGRVDVAEKTIRRKEAGIAPLAERVLRSVFTIEADSSFGSGFVAWSDEGGTYVLTAHHVVAGTLSGTVTVVRRGGGWQGTIVALDEKNDLALIRLSGRPRGIEPLWQSPRRTPPRTGDELLLVGSPFGLEGTVTRGVVSRVEPGAIQTDAAANPGNSGGPAIDLRGRVVGVLIGGGGENVNFAVPIARVCAKLRRC
jgi:S1-C subfamily serine protease